MLYAFGQSVNQYFSALWPIFDAASAAFALMLYLFVAGLGVYAMGAIVYNVVLARKRRKPPRVEPPTARPRQIEYPDGGEAREK
ncbi:MAG: hypothetical protein [Chaetfec virus UA24_244]|nr:MAG: hypothetical protein [Chaetfec virus UA24_244]